MNHDASGILSPLPLAAEHGGGRFSGMHTERLAGQWDAVTAAVVSERLGGKVGTRFLTTLQGAAAEALFNQLLGQREEPRIPVMSMVDARLAAGQTDGWHHADMPDDARAWQLTLGWLDDDARLSCGVTFAHAEWSQQHRVLQSIQNLGDELWHGLRAARVWSLWSRYACTAFYSHPLAWNEIGFAGPAYPRGYKNLGLNARDPAEKADVRPRQTLPRDRS